MPCQVTFTVVVMLQALASPIVSAIANVPIDLAVA